MRPVALLSAFALLAVLPGGMIPATAYAQPRSAAVLRFPPRVTVTPALRQAITRVYDLCARGDLARLSNLGAMFSPALVRKLNIRHRAVAGGSQDEPVDPIGSCGNEIEGEAWRHIARPNIRFEGGRPRATRAHVHLFDGNDGLMIDFLMRRVGRAWIVTDLLFPDGGMFMGERPVTETD